MACHQLVTGDAAGEKGQAASDETADDSVPLFEVKDRHFRHLDRNAG